MEPMIDSTRRTAWLLALALVACQPSAPPEREVGDEKAPASVEPAAQAPGWDNLRLVLVGVGRLSQGDQPEQAVLDRHRATVEGALEPMSACLRQSSAAREAKPVKLELRFGSDDTARSRVSPLVFNVADAELDACLREALGDRVAPGVDERIAVDVAVLVQVEVAG